MAKVEEAPGIIYPNGRTATRTEVRRKLLLQEMQGKGSPARQGTAPPKDRSLEDWATILVRRQQEKREVLPLPEHVDITIDTTEPVLLGLFGDVHAGADDFNAQRFVDDVHALTEVGGYAVTVGDLTDSGFFMPVADQKIADNEESTTFMRKALDALAKGGHLLAGWGGDHDLWAKDKMGSHTLYQEFQQEYGAPYLEGVSYVTLGLNNGQETVPYELAGAHQHRGISVYNDAHASLRMEKDEARGADVAFTAHNHIKAHLQQVVKEQGGGEHVIELLALGGYKDTDRYSRKKGWPRKGEESQGAFGLILDPKTKDVRVEWTIGKAVKALLGLK